MPSTIEARRIYDPPEETSGRRVLVDRPRGLAKDAANFDEWCKEVAPSTELRKWYGHDPQRFDEFRRRYLAELDQPERAAAVDELAKIRGRLVLLTAVKDLPLSHATVLAQQLRARHGRGASRRASPARARSE